MDFNDSNRPAASHEQDPLLSSINRTTSIGKGYEPSDGEYRSLKDQRTANICLIGAAMLSCIAYRIHAYWIPFSVVLYQAVFDTPGKPNNQ